MADYYEWAIRFLHIVSGVMWVGGIALWSMVIAPNVSKNLPPMAGGPFMRVILPRVSRYLSLAGVLTVLSGFWTMGILVRGFGNIVPQFQKTGYGRILGAGVVISVLMLVIAIAWIVPAANKLLEIGAKAPPPQPGVAPPPPPPEVLALRKRIMVGAMANLVLGFSALGLMALAVNTRMFG